MCFSENVAKFSEEIFFMQHLETAAFEFIGNAHSSFLPYLYVMTRRGGGLTSSGFYVGSPSG